MCPGAAIVSRKRQARPPPADPLQSAVLAGLRYSPARGPGITRRRTGRGFVYLDVDGRLLRDAETVRRIQALVIPPAWTDVWISPQANAHLQAVGRDARGRKQYRYHPGYRKVRDDTKFGRMMAFGAVLPKIRGHVIQDLQVPGLPKRKVQATVVRLLDTTFIRVGNDEYAKGNNSFGLTTLRDRHVQVEGHTLKFAFRGKSGQEHEIELTDLRLARIVKQCRDLPGYQLFQYIGDDGSRYAVDSQDVNNYLREITGEDFTAKDFRTWAGTGLMALALEECGPCETVTARKRSVAAAVKSVARQLGNRPATCRNYYIHPAIVAAYEDGSLFEEFSKVCPQGNPNDAESLRREEFCILAVIEKYLKKAAANTARAA